MTTVKYILLTINSRTIRVAIGVQPGYEPIVYWMEKGNIYSYVMFQGAMTEEEGNQILAAAEVNDYKTACLLFHKFFRGEESDEIYVEEEGLVTSNGEKLMLPISEMVSDEWFFECKEIMGLLNSNIRDVLTFERNEEMC